MGRTRLVANTLEFSLRIGPNLKDGLFRRVNSHQLRNSLASLATARLRSNLGMLLQRLSKRYTPHRTFPRCISFEFFGIPQVSSLPSSRLPIRRAASNTSVPR